jgi:DNA polymerase
MPASPQHPDGGSLPPPTTDPRQRRYAAQTVRTATLLGVPFVPVRPTNSTAAATATATAAGDARRPTAIVEAKPRDTTAAAGSTSPAAPNADAQADTTLAMFDAGSPTASDPHNRNASPDAATRSGNAAPNPSPNPSPEADKAHADPAAALDDLRERYVADPSTAAHLIDGWSNVVFGDGSPTAELMFVGEAPGGDEDAQGVPFVGRAGKKLNEMITAMGLTRQSVYIANVVKVRPPGNRDPTVAEMLADGTYLREQIAIIRPRVIVTLGRLATNFLLDRNEAMGKLRGRWFEYAGVPLVPTYHPAYLLRSYTVDNRRRVWSDLQMAMERLSARE